MSRGTQRKLAVRATELLGDRQWHPFVKLHYELMQVVPAGEARRRYLSSFARERKRKGVPLDQPRHRPMTMQQEIASGQRHIVTEFLTNGSVFETNRPGTPHPRPDQPERMIRMVKAHRGAAQDPVRAELNNALYDNELLHDAVAALRKHIVDAGLPDPVKKLGIVIPQQHGERGNT